jgi:hypothetical protein
MFNLMEISFNPMQFFTCMLEELVLSLMRFIWNSMPWQMKVLFVLFSIFFMWCFCKAVYRIGNRILTNFGEFREDVTWAADTIVDAAAWLKRKVSRVYWQMVEAHVDQIMLERARLRSPSPRRERGSLRRRAISRSPRPVRFSPASRDD